MSQITTLTFIRYADFKGRIWAFGMMQFAHKHLKKTEGLLHYKLMGSGKARFNPWPDWSTYALLQVWENEDKADAFLKGSKLMRSYRERSSEQWTLYLKNISAKGLWSGSDIFKKSISLDGANPYILVITRATIKRRFLWRFWRYVPKSQQPLEHNPGLLFTKGIGEKPLSQMATFSIWKDKKSLMAYAYSSKEHKEAIKKTRQLDWYKEELFSRFQPYRSVGTWHGRNILESLSHQK